MIIATAGHVDHGKTTLVQALTGERLDRAPEAQARGMTIDLGFAYWQIDAATRAAFIDVPGHERLLRNMAAGVAAIDLALLVVAADDGPMPQTLEHLAILQLLGVPRLVVALTKADRVDAPRLAEAAQQAGAMLAGGPFAQAPLFVLAAATGQGVPALRDHLAAQVARPRPQPAGQAHRRLRLAIDRSFSVAGAGRVVTGAVLSGQLRLGDLVQLAPQGAALRVRGLQVLGQDQDSASAGQRCALNLAGSELKRHTPERGDWLVDADAPPATERLDVLLQWLPGAPLPGPRAALTLHLGAAAVPARLQWLDAAGPAAASAQAGAAGAQHGTPAPGGWARLLLQRPVSAGWGERFILRDAAGNRTLAGGRVVDGFGPQRGSTLPQRLAQLQALAIDDTAAALAALLDTAPDGVAASHFCHARNLGAETLAALQQQLQLQAVHTDAGTLLLRAARWQQWLARLLQVVDDWHAAQPDSLGPDPAALRGGLSAATPGLQHALLVQATAQGLLVRDGLCHRRPAHRPVLAEADALLLERTRALLQPAGLRAPILGELALQLGLPVPALQAALQPLLARGLLVQVAPNRVYLPQTVQQLEAAARALAAASPDGRCDAATYRDHTGIGRNLAVQVLEFLDRSGVTRFDGTGHRPVG